MATITYYFSTISPYTYLAGTRLEAIAAKHGAEIVYKPLDIIALFGRTGGTPPKERHVSRQAYRAQDLVRQATKLGMEFDLHPAHWPTKIRILYTSDAADERTTVDLVGPRISDQNTIHLNPH